MSEISQHCMGNGTWAMEEWCEGFVSPSWVGRRELQYVMVAVRACGTYVAQYVWVGRPVVKLLFIRE